MAIDKTLEQLMKVTVNDLAAPDNLKNVCHMRWHGEPLPSQEGVERIVDLCRALIFPGFFGESDINRLNISYHIGLNLGSLYEVLVNQISAGLCFGYECENNLPLKDIEKRARKKAEKFIEAIPRLRRLLDDDAMAIYLGDPAAISTEEVIYCYPGLRAVTSYRIAHELYRLGVPVIPRMISEQAHSETGADIHPAATIGERFTIDHCTGVVIGATCVIGDDVKIYQGVTLGAKSFQTDDSGNPVKGVVRHPTIEDGVTIYANATILGTVTIGRGAIIGGNVWLTEDVAPGARVVQAPRSVELTVK